MKKIFFIAIALICSTSLFAQDNELQGSKQMQNPMLTQPIMVTIGGDFIVTGSFSASKFQRLDHFITQIYLEAKKEALGLTTEFVYSKRILKELDKYSLRNIIIKRADGTEKRIDLERFRITGNFDDNPYLRNDDVLIFPAIDNDKDFIAVEGAVNKPGKFQFVEGDKLSDAILHAMDISKAYENVNKAEISRLSYDGKNEQVINVNIKDDFELKRGDRIKILADENNRKDFRVTVTGHVKMPGEIFVTESNTTLREAIEKAGGLKPTAWLSKIQLYRGESAKMLLSKDKKTELEVKEMEQRLKWNNFEMARLSNLTIDDTSSFLADNELRFFNEIGYLNFTNIQDTNSEAGNFIVRDGDLIVVPEFENTINVFGQVPNAGKYSFMKDSDYNYYINKAGGFGKYAEEDDVMLIKNSGKSWIPISQKDNVKIEPGDFIWVPKEPQRTLEYYLKQAGAIASILGPIATIVVILVTAK